MMSACFFLLIGCIAPILALSVQNTPGDANQENKSERKKNKETLDGKSDEANTRNEESSRNEMTKSNTRNEQSLNEEDSNANETKKIDDVG